MGIVCCAENKTDKKSANEELMKEMQKNKDQFVGE